MRADHRSNLDCAIDASVGIKLFLVEPLSDWADALFDHLITTSLACFYMLDLFFVECPNSLWKYGGRFGYLLEAAHRMWPI
jgi:predicted nucleic acid-binding protein